MFSLFCFCCVCLKEHHVLSSRHRPQRSRVAGPNQSFNATVIEQTLVMSIATAVANVVIDVRPLPVAARLYIINSSVTSCV